MTTEMDTADRWTTIDSTTLSAPEAYRLLTGIIVPRPVAWITSRDGAGHVNLAPFSAYTMVSNSPPMVGVNIGLREGRRKDTARNIDETGEYVVNVPVWDQRHQVHASGHTFPPGTNEAAELALDLIDSERVGVPRLGSAPIAMECVLSDRVVFGDAGAEFTVGRVVLFHVRTDLIEDGKIDTTALDPVARVAGPTYSRLTQFDRLAPLEIGPGPSAQEGLAGQSPR